MEQLRLVPERRRIAESLGLQSGIWGAQFLLVACLFALGGRGPTNTVEWAISAVSGAVGLGLTGYEFWRRKNRTVLAKDGERIAVYRKGRLDLVLAPGAITRVTAGPVVMLQIGIPLGLCAAVFTAVGIVGLLRDGSGTGDNIMILALGLACGASLASAAWTRFSCRHLRVPVRNSRWLAEETVLVPRSRINDLFVDNEGVGTGGRP